MPEGGPQIPAISDTIPQQLPAVPSFFVQNTVFLKILIALLICKHRTETLRTMPTFEKPIWFQMHQSYLKRHLNRQPLKRNQLFTEPHFLTFSPEKQRDSGTVRLQGNLTHISMLCRDDRCHFAHVETVSVSGGSRVICATYSKKTVRYSSSYGSPTRHLHYKGQTRPLLPLYTQGSNSCLSWFNHREGRGKEEPQSYHSCSPTCTRASFLLFAIYTSKRSWAYSFGGRECEGTVLSCEKQGFEMTNTCMHLGPEFLVSKTALEN